MLLTSVGTDPSDNSNPIAYAAMDKEYGKTWRYFPNLLRIDLQLNNGRQVTFIPDKKNGLIQTFDEMFAI